jgi:hypothetical protein
MFSSLLADLAPTFGEYLSPLVFGVETTAPNPAPIVLAGPTTLELALVGILTLAIFSIAGRYRRQRTQSTGDGRQPGLAGTSARSQQTAPREAA